MAETSENMFQLKLKEENVTIFMSVIIHVLQCDLFTHLQAKINDTLHVN